MAQATDSINSEIEARTQQIGQRLLVLQRRHIPKIKNHWIQWFLDRVMANDRLRVQILRFVDVLPTLTDDDELLQHLTAYFDSDELNLPRLVRWGIKRNGLSKKFLPGTVRQLMGQFSKSFIGGADATQALKTAHRLHCKGIGFSLDLLGESVVSEDEADDYQNKYLKLIEKLPEQLDQLQPRPLIGGNGGEPTPRLFLSLKASSLYSQINPLDSDLSFRGIANRLRRIFAYARQERVSVCLDMEQYDYKTLLIYCFKRLLMEPEFRNWRDAGIAIQGYLKGSLTDIQDLIDWASVRKTPITVRLVRGAYWDYETVIARQHGWPVPVWENKSQTDSNYQACLELLLKNYQPVRTAVATHNLRSISYAMALAEKFAVPKDRIEFQMLYGMAQPLQSAIAASDYCLRVYVPFGDPLPGMAYLVRRLLENSSSQSILSLSYSPQIATQQLQAPEKTHHPEVSEKTFDSKILDHPYNHLPFRNEPLYRFTELHERATFASTIASVRTNLGSSYPMIINGREVVSGTEIKSINPSHPDEVIGKVSSASVRNVDDALEAAGLALKTWSRWGIKQRTSIILKVATLLRQRRMEFAALEILEAGKSWREADANVTEAIDFLEYYAREAEQLLTPRYRNCPGETNLLWYRPRGIGAIIPPWNFPLAILTGMLSAAIVTGNVVILKPSSQTPVIAAKFINLLAEAGIPPGVAQFLPGPGSSLGEYLVTHPLINFIAFTGSREIGTRIIEFAAKCPAKQKHIKKVIAEMGGKNAIIIDSDADLDEAVVGVVRSAFGYQGQKCSACSRAIVVGKPSALFVKRLVAAARSLKIGFPERPGVFMGPVIESSAKHRILETIEKGKGEAENILETDCSALGKGFFVGPTVFTNVPVHSNLGQQEIFGPVLSVMFADTFDQALDIANDSAYALTGGLYSRNPRNIDKARYQFQVGNLYINRQISGALVNRQPFGGFKLSGLGSKAGDKDYLLQFLHPCTFTEKTLRRGFAPDFAAP